MYAGRKVEEAAVGGPVRSRRCIPTPTGLLASIPQLDERGRQGGGDEDRLNEIPGMVPPLTRLARAAAPSRRAVHTPTTSAARSIRRYEEKRPGHWRRLLACGPHRRGGTPWLTSRRSARIRVRAGHTPPVLEVDDLKKHFPGQQGRAGARTVGHVHAVDGVSLQHPRGARPWGWSARAAAARPPSGAAVLRLIEPTAGRIELRGADVTAPRQGELRPHRRQMQIIFQDPFSSLNPRMSVGPHRRRAARDPRHRQPARSTRTASPRLLERVGLRAAQMRALPARVLRRPAPAHRHRPGAGAEAQADHRRRAGLGPRRLDPGAGDQPADGPAARSSACPTCSSPTTWRWSSTSATGSRSCTSAASSRSPTSAACSPSPQHPYTEALLSAVPIPDPTRQAQEAHPAGRRPEPHRPALRLPLPHPLPVRRGALPRGRAAAARGRAGPRGGLPPALNRSPESIHSRAPTRSEQAGHAVALAPLISGLRPLLMSAHSCVATTALHSG